MNRLTLISHTLCPYVQRAAIALTEKGVAHDRIYIDLSDKPDWFRDISPLGKVPVLKVEVDTGETAIFESAVILEYLEETQPHPLHPADPLERARHRSWMEFGSSLLNAIARLYRADSGDGFNRERDGLRTGLERLESELLRRESGPFFDGEAFSLVDTVFGPVFRYFDTFEERAGLYIADGLPGVGAWRSSLNARASVRQAVDGAYPDLLTSFLERQNSHISGLISQAARERSRRAGDPQTV